MRRVAVRVLIPIREDATIGTGAKHPKHRWVALQDAFFSLYGGKTDRGVVDGVWRDPKTNETVTDRSREFEIDVPEEQLDEFRALVRRISVTFVQQAIRIVVRGEAEYISGDPEHDDHL